MMLFSSITSMFSHKSTHRSSALGLNPAREWIVGLVIAFLLLSLGAAYASFFFWSHLHRSDAVEVSTEGMVAYKKELIREVLEYYESREVQFDAIRSQTGVETVPRIERQEPAVIFDEDSLGAE